MDAFERCNQAPPTEEEWIRREQDLERAEELRLRAMEEQTEYAWVNAVEIPEFTGRQPSKMERMQMDFGFGEAA
jgi:hypothetical protein